MDRTRFLTDFALSNEACILDATFTAHWDAIRDWRRPDGEADIDYLVEEYGNMDVPVVVGAGGARDQMTVATFIRDCILTPDPDCYLKDWHFQHEIAGFDDDLLVYEVPTFLNFDWLNRENYTPAPQLEGDDYRFVYFGAPGSWTKFHVDVMSSYSWSANICGRKLWYLMRPGAEEYFRLSRDELVPDIREYRDRWADAGVMEVVQYPGEIMFVPSGWHHQVHNLTTTISINHNVINACNANFVFSFVETRLKDVEKEISHEKDSMTPEDFYLQCQDVLLADIHLNRSHLLVMVETVLASREALPRITEETGDDGEARRAILDVAQCLDAHSPSRQRLDALKAAILKRCTCDGFDDFCDHCERFWRTFEYERAVPIRNYLQEMMPEDSDDQSSNE